MSTSGAHILVYPFPAPGHIIPLLDLTHLLLTRGLTVTVLVKPTHLPLLQPLLSTHPSSSIQSLVLSPPDPSPASHFPIVAKFRAMGELYHPILDWFQSHPSPPVAILSDFLLGWTTRLASELGIQRVVFSPSSGFALSMAQFMWRDPPKYVDVENAENALFSFPEIPNSPKFHYFQIAQICDEYKEGDPDWEFFRNCILANLTSWGVVFNSFTELERIYIDHMKKEMGHDRVWAVGPLLPSFDDSTGPTERGWSSAVPAHEVMTWLNGKTDKSVVYVCFGSRMMLTNKQMEALGAAIECSKVHFIWCVQATNQGRVATDSGMIPDGFEDRVGDRGFVIKGWAPQVAILRHRAVGVFVTHCGWNSVLEGIEAGVMMLTWPLGAEQFTAAKLLVEQLGVAIRACEGATRTVPDSADLASILAESVSCNRPERVRVMELRNAACEAVNGGSSNKDLHTFVKQLSELKK